MRHSVVRTDCMSVRKAMTIRIKNPTRAVISASDDIELSDEEMLTFALWIVAKVARKRFYVDEVELVLDAGES